MGAWGVGSLDNDGSLDWLADFGESGASAAVDVLNTAAEGVADGYVEADVAAAIVVLAEVIAASLGKPDEDLSDQLSEPVEQHKDALLEIDKVQARTLEALEAIMTDGETSELYDLWQESDEFDAWAAQMKSLHARLDAA
jgi:hypothetical protein